MADFDTEVTNETRELQNVLPSKSKAGRRERRWRIARGVEPHYDALVRRLQVVDKELAGKGPLAIGITSTQQGEGVTTVAINLALAAKKFSPDPILLVDANVSRPSLTRIFRARGREGLENVLAGDASVFDCLVDSPVEGISLMPPGKLASGKRARYDVTSIEQTLDSIKHVFPLIVVDLPPVDELTSCLALAGCLDGVVIVIEAGRVNFDVARRAKHQLQQSGAKLLGIVLNKQKR